MQSEHPFSDVGLDPITGAELFRILGVSDTTFKDPQQVSKIREIAEFAGGYQDSIFVLERALRRNPSKSIPPVDALLSFVKLHKERNGLKEKLALTEKELAYYE